MSLFEATSLSTAYSNCNGYYMYWGTNILSIKGLFSMTNFVPDPWGCSFWSCGMYGQHREVARLGSASIWSQSGGCRNCPENSGKLLEWKKQSKQKCGWHFFSQFESPQIGSNQIEYLVRSSLVQLCCGPVEVATLSVSKPGLTTLDWQKWGCRQSLQALPMYIQGGVS